MNGGLVFTGLRNTRYWFGPVLLRVWKTFDSVVHFIQAVPVTSQLVPEYSSSVPSAKKFLFHWYASLIIEVVDGYRNAL